MKSRFIPDSITDLHYTSMNAGMKDMLNVMDTFLAMGMSLDDVILCSTWNPAKEIRHEELGNLSVGAPADATVLRIEKGKVGFVDQVGGRLDVSERLLCEMTLRVGVIVYDLNGMSAVPCEKVPPALPSRGPVARPNQMSRRNERLFRGSNPCTISRKEIQKRI